MPFRWMEAWAVAESTISPEVRITCYEVSCLPEDSINYDSSAVRVEYRGQGGWAVVRGGKRCLSLDGEWDWESRPSEREGVWLLSHRFDLETALRLAQEAAPQVVINGMTPAQVLVWEAAQ